MQTLFGYSSQLSSGVSSTATTLPVNAIPLQPITDTVYCLNLTTGEQFSFSGVTGTSGGAGSLTGVSRGLGGTTAASMSANSDVLLGTAFQSTEMVRQLPSNAYGVIFDSNTLGVSNTFATNGGSIVLGTSGNNLTISNTVGTYLESIDLHGTPSNSNYSTGLNTWTIAMVVNVGTVTGTSYGAGIGIRSCENQTNQRYSVVGQVNTSIGPALGEMYIVAGTEGGNEGVVSNSSSGAISVSTNNVLLMVLERDQDTIAFTVQNLTTGGLPVIITYQFDYAYPASVIAQNTGHFSIFCIGGQQTIYSFSVASKAVKSPQVVTLGDSKMVYYPGFQGDVWPTLLGKNITVTNLGCGSDTTFDVLARLPEVIALAPKTVILCIGRNDIAATSPAITLEQTEINYASIVNQLEAAGINVVHLLPIYDAVVNQSALTTWISAEYEDTIYSELQNYSADSSLVLSPDGVHPTAFGHWIIYEAIYKSGLVPTSGFLGGGIRAGVGPSF